MDDQPIQDPTWRPQRHRRPRGTVQALGKDAKASVALRNIATYFVKSNRTGYPSNNTETITVGTLDHAEAERQFAAQFDFDDILDAYNAIDGNAPISRDELIAIMGALVGGWPETGMSDRLTVRLSGRIDRLEHRRTADGREQVRLIDYKTGKVPNGRSLFSDLQLVCYQLGLAFPEHDGKRGAQAIATMPDITQSACSTSWNTRHPRHAKGKATKRTTSRRCSPAEASTRAISYPANTCPKWPASSPAASTTSNGRRRSAKNIGSNFWNRGRR